MRHHRRSVLLAIVLVGCVTADASADWVITPYAGLNWAAAATFNDAALSYDDEFKSSFNVGAEVDWINGPLAVGFDFGYLPEFFADRKADDDFEFGSSYVLTMMANVAYTPFQIAGLRPYGAGGFGVMKTHITDEFELFTVSSTNAAFNVGGGVQWPLGARYGIRGDARYFRTVQEKLPEREVDVAIGSLSFWRFTGGVTIKF
jgi:outer membrane protein with beta-barrel domain